MKQALRDTLIGARGIVEAGWHQGNYTDGQGNFCLKAAIGIASGDMIVQDRSLIYRGGLPERKLSTAACVAVTDHLPTPFVSIPVFNDDPQTDLPAVLGVLDKAISGCGDGR